MAGTGTSFLPDIIRVIISKTIRFEVRVAEMGDEKLVCSFLAGA
jgi:hypothetical protein